MKKPSTAKEAGQGTYTTFRKVKCCFTPGIEIGEVRLGPPEPGFLLAVLTRHQVLGGLSFLEGAHQPALVFQTIVPLQESYIRVAKCRGQRELVLCTGPSQLFRSKRKEAKQSQL